MTEEQALLLDSILFDVEDLSRSIQDGAITAVEARARCDAIYWVLEKLKKNLDEVENNDCKN